MKLVVPYIGELRDLDASTLTARLLLLVVDIWHRDGGATPPGAGQHIRYRTVGTTRPED